MGNVDISFASAAERNLISATHLDSRSRWMILGVRHLEVPRRMMCYHALGEPLNPLTIQVSKSVSFLLTEPLPKQRRILAVNSSVTAFMCMESDVRQSAPSDAFLTAPSIH